MALLRSVPLAAVIGLVALSFVVALNPIPLFDPQVEIDCLKTKIKITVKNTDSAVTVVMSDCGMHTIDPTSNEVAFFDKNDCVSGSIPADGVPFIITIQQLTTSNPLLDRVFDVECDKNTAILSEKPIPVDGVLSAEICPEAILSVKMAGTMTDFISGAVGDMVYLDVSLIDFHRDDYDIVCDRLTVNSVVLMDMGCTLDSAIIPTFSKVSQGVLQTSVFSMFRAGPNILSTPTDMLFECTLMICLGPCSVGTCMGGEDARGRKRRRDVTSEATVLYRYPIYRHVTLYPRERPRGRVETMLKYLEISGVKSTSTRLSGTWWIISLLLLVTPSKCYYN